MDATTSLITIAVIAWVLQIATGFFQVRSFNRMLREVSSKGEIKIGKHHHVGNQKRLWC